MTIVHQATARDGAIVFRVRDGLPLGVMPPESTSFVGRRRELSEVKKVLSAARLVTLTGVGGVGKTRLAMRVAWEVRRAFPDGTRLVELAALTDPELIPQTIADSLGIRDRSSRAPIEAVLVRLADSGVLLVLDNCEHLGQACTVVATTLLHALPRLKILATSRNALGISGEHVFTVPPLPLPSTDGDNADTNDAVQLFVERARAFGTDVGNGEHLATIAQLCRRLDGLPLAIELAAAQVRTLAPQQILERLHDRFRLLTRGYRDRLPRQHTLQAAVDWSYELCSPLEQTVWARASVFAGGFDIEAASAVCTGGAVAAASVLDLVAGLVDKSILTRDDDGTCARYRLLETLREYGHAKLRSRGELLAVRRRHRDYYRRLVRLAEDAWVNSAQPAWGERLRREHANLRVALDFCCTQPGEELIGLTTAASLWTYWVPCGVVSEGRHWLDQTLMLASEPTPVRAKALWVAGWVAQLQSDLDGAAMFLDECRALADRLGYRAALAYALHYSARATMARGDHCSALALYADALLRHRALGNRAGTMLLLFELALCYALRGDPARGDLDLALAICAECIRRCEASGEIWCRSYAHSVRGLALWLQGHHREARASVLESIRLTRAFHDEPGFGLNLELLAWIAVSDGDHEHAAYFLGAANRVWESIGGALVGIKQLREYSADTERRARKALGAARFGRAFRQGTESTLEHAVGRALGEAIGRTSAGKPSAASPLTRREREVAELVAQGLSNAEIARQLVISRRTAEGHVERIFTKLGFTARTQLGVWVLQHRTDPP